MSLKINADIPSLDGATTWHNGPVTAESLRGAPTLIHFWSVSCGICSEQMPQVNAWRESLAPRGLRLVGIHMPRSEKDLDLPRVAEAVSSYGLTHPVAVDNTHTLVDAFDNKYVPAFYVFDAEGHLRLFQAGEKGLPLVEKALQRALNRAAEDVPG